MTKKFWMLAIGYTVLAILLDNVLGTALGGFLKQLSFLGLGFGIIWVLYRLIKNSIESFLL